MKIAIIVPTPDDTQWPATEAIGTALRTTEGLDVQLVPVVSSGPDFSFSRSVNAGFRNSPSADAWVLLNDDCFMDEGWLHKMIEATMQHPEVGVVGGLLRYPDGKIQHAGGFVTKSLFDPRFLVRMIIDAIRNRTSLQFLNHPFRRRWLLEQLASGRYEEIEVVVGACMLITRACFEKIGGFDEDYPLSAEDTDYCLRAREAGFGIMLASEVTGIHFEGVATGQGGFWGRGPSGLPKTISYHIFCDKWSPSRIRNALANGGGTIHPAYCKHRRVT